MEVMREQDEKAEQESKHEVQHDGGQLERHPQEPQKKGSEIILLRAKTSEHVFARGCEPSFKNR